MIFYRFDIKNKFKKIKKYYLNIYLNKKTFWEVIAIVISNTIKKRPLTLSSPARYGLNARNNYRYIESGNLPHEHEVRFWSSTYPLLLRKDKGWAISCISDDGRG